MEEKQKTIYCGSGIKRTDQWITATVQLNKAQEHFFEYEGKSYLKLNININTEKDRFGKDVALSVNTYKPPTDENETPVETKKSDGAMPW